MRNPETMLRVYEELAERFASQNEPRFRDHCLVLAADAALSSGRGPEADRLRQRLLQFNPHHLLRPFASMGEAMQAPDVQEYVADLRRQWPPEFVQKLYLGGKDQAMPKEEAAEPKLLPSERTKGQASQRTEPGRTEPEQPESLPARPAQAKVQDLEAEPPASAPRRTAVAPVPRAAAAVPPMRPARVVLPESGRAAPAAPSLAPPMHPFGSWLATMLLFVGIACGLGLFFLAFIWPLLD